MADPIHVARYLLQLASREAEAEPITQMRLHKLLYYVQGWSLAQRGEPLFAGRIEAWTHGPVVRQVYPAFADFGDAPIAPPAGEVELNAADRAFVESIWESYKMHSATRLRAMTHRERPWRETRGGLSDAEKSDSEIPQDLMAEFFHDEFAQHQVPGLELDRIRRAEQDIAAGRYVELDDVFAAA
jgi:uncharacterized phage-associated protein